MHLDTREEKHTGGIHAHAAPFTSVKLHLLISVVKPTHDILAKVKVIARFETRQEKDVCVQASLFPWAHV